MPPRDHVLLYCNSHLHGHGTLHVVVPEDISGTTLNRSRTKHPSTWPREGLERTRACRSLNLQFFHTFATAHIDSPLAIAPVD
jgi:hypothetical protein